MDFNLDDPLGDILSEGSNDSFFESSKPKHSLSASKTQPKKPLLTSTPKGKIDDLFGIKDTTENPKVFQSEVKMQQPQKQPSSLTAEFSSAPKKPQESQISKPMTPIVSQKNINDDDDLIADLGFDPKKPKSTKSSILDDLLGIDSKKHTSGVGNRPNTATNVNTSTLFKDEPKTISRQSTETTTDNTLLTTSLVKSKTPGITSATSRKQTSSILNDPLGLFGNTPSKNKEVTDIKDTKDTPKPKRKGNTADWLGLDSETKPTNELNIPAQTSVPKEEHTIQNNSIQQQQPSNFVAPSTLPTPSAHQGAILMATANLEAQNALHTLKQQEIQVAMATQIKAQEMALLEMQRCQQELLQQQEAQFNELLQKQLIKQNQLEMNIKSQQERINTHIQLLMSQTGVPLTPESSRISSKHKTEINEDKKEDKLDEIHLETEVKRLELEKLRLEDLISNVNANHEKEIEYLESSHKKQIKVLEESLQSIQERFQSELQYLEQFYGKKIELIQHEQDESISSYEKKIKNMQGEYEIQISKVKSQHDDNLKTLKEDYHRMIENIRQSKLLEFAAVQENQSYLETLRSASGQLEIVSGDLEAIRDEITRKIDLEHKEYEMKLKAREKRLEDSERRLKTSEEATEQEKSRLIELVTTLEVQLIQLQHDSSEERWTFNQKLSSLEAERASFEREKQFSREQLSRDQKHLDQLKQSQMEEYQRLMQQIQDEKHLFAIEKAKLETAKKLEASSDTQTAKIELEAALKVAQDAAKQADQERERYYGLQRQLEAKKRELIEQENIVKNKQDELETAICSAKARERQIQEMIQKNRLAEEDLKTKIQLLQIQMQRITEREARLSQDRLILSKERIHLQELKHKLQQTKCNLCRIGEKSAEISKLLAHQNPCMEESNDIKDLMNIHLPNLFDVQHNSVYKTDHEDEFNGSVRNLERNVPNLDDNRFESSFDIINNSVPTTNFDSDMMLSFDIKNRFEI